MLGSLDVLREHLMLRGHLQLTYPEHIDTYIYLYALESDSLVNAPAPTWGPLSQGRTKPTGR
jgi:hypothetical protein